MDIRQILVSAIYPAGIVMLTSALVAAPHLNGGSDDPRQMASGYWLAAVYGSALVLGLSLAVASRAGSRPKLPGLELMGPLFVAGIWAAIASLAGWVAGNYLANEWMVPPRNPAVVGYWSAHFAGYSAVLVTGLITCWWAWRKRKRAREIEGTIVYHIDRDVSTFRAIKPLADWQNLLVTLAGLLAVVGMVTVLMWRHDISPAIWLALAVAFTLLMGALARKVPWRLVLNVCQFRTHSTPSFDVHYAAELEHGLDWPSFDNQIDADLKDLAGRFGFGLGRRLVIYLFPSYVHVEEIFGRGYGGTALFRANAILVARTERTHESIRHEIAHLFGAFWNSYAPPLLAEGLATWLQGTQEGKPVEEAARPFLRWSCWCLSLQALLSWDFFIARRDRWLCYPVAGSFTGFLIRRFGWDKYRLLYRTKPDREFAARFKDLLGITLEDADRDWRGTPAGDGESPVLDLNPARDQCPTHKILSMLLLFAIREGATELRFEPLRPTDVIRVKRKATGVEPKAKNGATTDDLEVLAHEDWFACRVRYKLAGELLDTVPGLFDTSAIAQHIARAGRLESTPDEPSRREGLLATILRRKPIRKWQGRVPALVGATALDLPFSIESSSRPGWKSADTSVVVQLPTLPDLRDEAGRQLKGHRADDESSAEEK